MHSTRHECASNLITRPSWRPTHPNGRCRPKTRDGRRLMNAYWLWLALFSAAALLWPASSRSGEPNWPDQLTIGTASPGGTYYVYGDGLAKILTRALDLPVARLATEGPAQNIELLEAGEAKLGFVTIG